MMINRRLFRTAFALAAAATILLNGCARRHAAQTAFTSPPHQGRPETGESGSTGERVAPADWERVDALAPGSVTSRSLSGMVTE